MPKKTFPRSASSLNAVLDYKTKVALEGLPPHLQNRFLTEVSTVNQPILARFLYDLVMRDNASQNTKLMYTKNLIYLLRSVNHKQFSQISREDILSYLHSLRRPLPQDPDQKWINTHNNRAVMYQKFFKWLAAPESSSNERPLPSIAQNIPLYKKKELTHVKARDLWTPDEDALFLKYCDDVRLQFYHMLSFDTSARPHELLNLRIGDIKIKYAGDKTYAEAEVGRGGKTKSRVVPLITSLPYFKALLAKHPEPANPQAFIFRSVEKSAKYRNTPISRGSLSGFYSTLKRNHFPKLLERADVPPEEKQRIRDLIQKPWNPYIRRHTSLTEKAKLLNEYSLRLHAGWTKSSKMVEIYTHELGGESSAKLLEAYGILPKGNKVMNKLEPRACPSCKEGNKYDAKFCSKCSFPLSIEGYEEIKKKEKEDEDKLAEVLRRQEQFERVLQNWINSGKLVPRKAD